jgi:hypothetical protein
VTLQEAFDLVLREGLEEDGLCVLVRMGQDPGRERIKKLLEALRVLYEQSREEQHISRSLAYALFAIAFTVQGYVQGAQRSTEWSDEFVDDEQYRICLAVQSVFANQWAE